MQPKGFRQKPPFGPPEVSSVLTIAKLKSRSVKDLASTAKRRGIAGWHSMRKDELIQALMRMAKAGSNGHSK
jgi:hypothetical protein